jgi:SagB-type dehydrogenase family enzyme
VLSSLLNFACGKRDQKGKRRYPSGGGLYPVDIYLSLNHLAVKGEGLNKGTYRYDAELDCLLKIIQMSIFELSQFSKVFVPNAAGVIFLAFDLAKPRPNYGGLGYKLALLESGHIAQNILLVMETLGLNGLPLQFYYEDIVNNLLSLSSQDQSVCYAIEFGIKPKNLKGVN